MLTAVLGSCQRAAGRVVAKYLSEVLRSVFEYAVVVIS